MRRKPARVILELEALEDRCLPALGFPATTWEPPPNTQNLNWSNKANWSTGQVPAAGTPAIFNAAASTEPVNVDMDPGGVLLSISNGYKSTMTINPGINMEINDFSDANPSTDNWVVSFGNESYLTFEGNGTSTIYNASFSGPADTTTYGMMIDLNCTVVAGSQPGYSTNLSAVDDYGTLTIGNSGSLGNHSTVGFGGGTVNVIPAGGQGGVMNVYAAPSSATPINSCKMIYVKPGGTLNMVAIYSGEQFLQTVLEDFGTANVFGGYWDFTNTNGQFGNDGIDVLGNGVFNVVASKNPSSYVPVVACGGDAQLSDYGTLNIFTNCYWEPDGTTYLQGNSTLDIQGIYSFNTYSSMYFGNFAQYVDWIDTSGDAGLINELSSAATITISGPNTQR